MSMLKKCTVIFCVHLIVNCFANQQQNVDPTTISKTVEDNSKKPSDTNKQDKDKVELQKQLPISLSLILPISQIANITLNLKKSTNDAVSDDVLIIVGSHDSDIIWKPKNKEALASYKDDKGSTFEVVVLKENEKTKFIYYGMYLNGNESYVLKPEEECENITEGVYPVELNGTKYKVFHRPEVAIVGHDEGIAKTTSKIISVLTRTTITPKVNSNAENTNNNENGNRRKRSARNKRATLILENVIDILVVPDYSVYKSWLDFNHNDSEKAIANMKYYYAQVVNGISNKFKTIQTSRFRYSAKMIAMFVATTPEDCHYIEGPGIRNEKNEFEFDSVLTAFTRWLNFRVKYDRLPEYDIAAAYTKYSGGGATGFGWFGTVCTDQATSITTDEGAYSTIDIGAHEIGYNLGSKHDGEGNNCNPRHQYLMTTVQQPGKFNNLHTFSECSIEYFAETVNKMQKRGRNCLRQSAKNYENVEEHLKIHMGQIWNHDVQCKFAYGPKSFFVAKAKNLAKIFAREWTAGIQGWISA